MLPKADLRRMERLRLLLAESVAQEDWSRIAQIDVLIRQSLQRLSATGELSAQARAELAPLKALHGQALHTCARECQRLRGLLERHTEHGEGRNAYSLAGSAQGGGIKHGRIPRAAQWVQPRP